MPPTKEQAYKHSYNRSYSNNGMSLSARVYQPATNLMPPTPPPSPTKIPPFASRPPAFSADRTARTADNTH
ncbi:unnamed protein product [Danaus chrysippus]|uniref:(African queen) hypothetical protein n=1 Tax=Danaus chrysippus TaxID=151541 RepID=A0A8J2QC25_9NEOP|nr:unnamed protein product [Danaus chrysippus]